MRVRAPRLLCLVMFVWFVLPACGSDGGEPTGDAGAEVSEDATSADADAGAEDAEPADTGDDADGGDDADIDPADTGDAADGGDALDGGDAADGGAADGGGPGDADTSDAADAVDAADAADTSDAADTADTSDAADAVDAADAADTSDTPDTGDTADTSDTADASDAADASDVLDASDTGRIEGTLTVDPELAGVIADNPAEVTVTFTTPGARTAPATVTFAGVPAGVTVTPPTLEIPAEETSGTVEFSSDIDTAFAIADVEVTADDGTYAAMAELSVIVTEYPELEVAYAPLSLAVARGDEAVLTATVNRDDGWTGRVDVDILGLPTGVTATPNPVRVDPFETVATVTFTAGAEASEGLSTLTLRSAIPLRTREDELELEVLPPSGFEVAVPAESTVVAQGESASVEVGVDGIPSAYPLTVTATTVPDGFTVSAGEIAGVGEVATIEVEAAEAAVLGIPASITVELSDGSTIATGSFEVEVVPALPSPLDATFGVEGLRVSRIRGNNGYVGGLMDDGRLVTSGTEGQIDVWLADGSRDESFGEGGAWVYSQSAQWRCLQRTDAGAFVVAGVRGSTLVVARVTGDGVLDTTWGDEGVAIFEQSATLDGVDGCELDALGRLLVTSASETDTADVSVIRLTTAGALDDTFGDEGRVLIDLGANEYAYRVTVDGAGRVLVAAYEAPIGPNRMFVARLTEAGALDATFGDAGIVSLPTLQYPVALDVLADGRIAVLALAGGETWSTRLDGETGAVDTTFGTDGFTSVLVGDALDSPVWGVFDSAGAAWVALSVGLSNEFGVLRLDAAGALDTSFSSDGWASINTGDPRPRVFTLVVDEPRGVYVLGGASRYGLIALFAR